MAQELKAFTVNLKSLDQDIEDPIVAGAGDADGRTLRIIFTQEAAAQFTPESKVYLSWHHKEQNVSGLNVFKKVSDEPMIWEIKYPQSMLFEGNVLCTIKLVDSLSIVQSTNFIVHILSDPDDGSLFVASDDYTVFQNAVIDLTSISEKMKAQMEAQAKDFAQMKSEFAEMDKRISDARETADRAYDLAQLALGQGGSGETTTTGIYLTEY